MKKSLKMKQVNLLETPTYSYWYWFGIPLLLFLSTFYSYYPSLTYQFQFDDIANIVKHFKIRHYTFWDLFFTGPRWISYWLNSLHYSFGKFDPYSYRFFNVCLHSANGILLFLILLTSLSKRKRDDFFKKNASIVAALTALLFVLHPVQTQTVSYVIQGQLEGLATFFILSMIFVYIHICYMQVKAMKRIAYILLIVLTFFSCCTKEIAIISPVLLLLIDWFFIAQGSWKQFKSRMWVHGSIVLLVGAIYTYFFTTSFFLDIFSLKRIAHNNIGNVITHNSILPITPIDYFISQFKVLLHYFWIFLWPFSISVEYDWVLSLSFFSLDSCLPFLILCTLIFFIIRIIQQEASSMIAFGFCWFLICMAPRSTIIPSPELVADYKTYTASAGWLFLIAALIVCVSQKIAYMSLNKHFWVLRTPYTGPSALIGFMFFLGFFTMQRNMVWRSGLEFWGNIIQNAPGKARAYNNYGVELLKNCKKYKESIPYFMKAIAIDANYYDPYHNVAVAYLHTNQTSQAMDALSAGLKINPSYPEGYNNLASFLLQQGQYDKAESALYTALQLRPHYGKAHYNLGRLYFETGKHELAWTHFRDACMKCDLDDEMGFSAFAKISLLLQKYDDAIFGYTKTLEIIPDDHDSLFNLANAYLLAQRPNEARQIYEHLVDLYPHDIRAWYNLGEVYFMKDQVNQALACFKKITSPKGNFPSYHIRVAQCYGKLGNFEAAYRELDCMDAADMSSDVTSSINSIKEQINKLEKQWLT